MHYTMEVIFEWASAKLITEDEEPAGGWPTIGMMYADFRRWAGSDARAAVVTAQTFGRHVRNIDGVDVKRRSHGAVAKYVRLMRLGDARPTFQAKLRLRAPKLTKLEARIIQKGEKSPPPRNGVPSKSAAISAAVGALEMIRQCDDIERTKILATEALSVIGKMRDFS